MVAVNAQRFVSTGLNPAYAAASATLDFDCDDVVLHVKNGGVGSINATIETPGSVDGDLAVADRVVAIGAGAERFIGPLASKSFKRSDTGQARVTLSGTTSVTVAAFTF